MTRPTVIASVKALEASNTKVLPMSNEFPERLSDETQNQQLFRDEGMILDDHVAGNDIVIGAQAVDDGMDTGDEDNGVEVEEDEESMEADSSASSSEDSEDDSEEDDDDDDDDEDDDDDDDEENGIESDEEDEFDEGSNDAEEELHFNAMNEVTTQDLIEDDEDQPPPFNGSNIGDGEWTLLGGPAGASGRQRSVMDAAHAMINQIMRSGEVGQTQLQELQEQLGLRIVQNGVARPAHTTATVRSSSPGGLIWQQQQPASGYSSLGGTGTNELNSMEFLFSVLSSGNPNYSLVRPPSRETGESSAARGVFDEAPLFPGGPMASRARPVNPQHPLHEALHFPPPNALAYHAEPNGTRARASSHPLPSRRPAGHGNYFSRTTPSSQRSPAVQSGWSDYDYGRNVDSFTSGFETAFTSAMLTPTIQPDQSYTATNATEPSNAPEESGLPSQLNSTDSPEQRNEAAESVQGLSGDGNSVGEAVASSLATGLRLTSSAPQDRPANGEEDQERHPEEGAEDAERLQEEEEEEGTPVEGSESPPGDNVQGMDVEAEGRNGEVSEEGTQEHATETNTNETSNTNETTITNESLSTSANSISNTGVQDDNNEVNPSNEDTMIACPPGADIDPSVWAALPREMQEELAGQAAGSEPSECPEGYDQDVWAALPQEMRDEVLRETRRESQSQEEAADPRNATEMDNASFVAVSQGFCCIGSCKSGREIMSHLTLLIPSLNSCPSFHFFSVSYPSTTRGNSSYS